MPTLIRLFVFLIVLGLLGLGGMVALTVMVDPGEKDITIKIPARELVPPPETDLDVNNLPAPVNVAPKEEPSASEVPSAPADISIDTSDPEADESGVKTVDTGTAE
jgi:hypothetical protein